MVPEIVEVLGEINDQCTRFLGSVPERYDKKLETTYKGETQRFKDIIPDLQHINQGHSNYTVEINKLSNDCTALVVLVNKNIKIARDLKG